MRELRAEDVIGISSPVAELALLVDSPLEGIGRRCESLSLPIHVVRLVAGSMDTLTPYELDREPAGCCREGGVGVTGARRSSSSRESSGTSCILKVRADCSVALDCLAFEVGFVPCVGRKSRELLATLERDAPGSAMPSGKPASWERVT